MCDVVASVPQLSAAPPPARKKYTLAEVFGDDDEEDEDDNSEDVPAAAAAAARQDFGRPSVPGKPLQLRRQTENWSIIVDLHYMCFFYLTFFVNINIWHQLTAVFGSNAVSDLARTSDKPD